MRQQLDVFDFRARIARNFERMEIILDKLESGAASEPGVDRVKIDAVAEIRHNMALAQTALDAANSAEAAQTFEQLVIDLLAQQSPRIRKQLIGKLNEARKDVQPQSDPNPATRRPTTNRTAGQGSHPATGPRDGTAQRPNDPPLDTRRRAPKRTLRPR